MITFNTLINIGKRFTNEESECFSRNFVDIFTSKVSINLLMATIIIMFIITPNINGECFSKNPKIGFTIILKASSIINLNSFAFS